MKNIKITVGNHFIPNVFETFITYADITDLIEMEYVANECCGKYLDMHGDIYNSVLPDVDWDAFSEACFYSIEEVPYEA